jgi:hypothetical protein
VVLRWKLNVPADEEEEQEADDYDCEDDPADPVIPCAAVAATVPVLVITSDHDGLVWC